MRFGAGVLSVVSIFAVQRAKIPQDQVQCSHISSTTRDAHFNSLTLSSTVTYSHFYYQFKQDWCKYVVSIFYNTKLLLTSSRHLSQGG